MSFCPILSMFFSCLWVSLQLDGQEKWCRGLQMPTALSMLWLVRCSQSFWILSIVLILSVVLFSQNAHLFFLTILLLPIYAVIIFAFMKPFERLNNETMEANSVLSSSIIEDINGIETIKSLTSERSRYQKIDSEFVDYLKKSFAMSKAESLQKGSSTWPSWFWMFWSCGWELIWSWSKNWVLGQLITYNTLLVYFTGPLENFDQPPNQTSSSPSGQYPSEWSLFDRLWVRREETSSKSWGSRWWSGFWGSRLQVRFWG